MILGIGTDIVEIERFRNTTTLRDNLAKRICTDYEFTEYNKINDDLKAAYIAKKWAAKEAISKAWGTGIRGDTRFKSIEIRHNDLGKPIVCFYDKLRHSADIMNAKCHLSISDTAVNVVAYSIIEYNPILDTE
jgi:holo-[acyl-carrier protein] synthase